MTTTYLSPLLLDTRNSVLADVLADAHRLHAWLLTAFPAVTEPHTARHAHGILYRLEDVRESYYGARILVQSQTLPDWSIIPTRGLLRSMNSNPSVREIEAQYACVSAGQVYRFRLRASPTKSVAVVPGAGKQRIRGVRKPILHQEAQQEWLRRQGERLGFAIATSTIVEQGKIYGIKHNPDQSRTAITHSAIVFEGVLEVTDTQMFGVALRDGVGRGKAYGLGLLSVAHLPIDR